MMFETCTANWILTLGQTPLAEGEVTIDKTTGQFSAIGVAEVNPAAQGTTFLTPGLINCHTHLELYANAPIPILSEESMADWLIKVVETTRPQTDSQRLSSAKQSILELIRTGTTCVNDITSNGVSIEALDQVGMRAVVSPEFFYPAHDENPDVSAVVALFQKLQARFENHPLLKIGISPHSPYNVTAKAWQAVLEATDPFLIHTHLAETVDEMEWFQSGQSSLDKVHERFLGKRFGPVASGITPVNALKSVLNDRTVAAHGIYLTPEDTQLLAHHGVSVAHCPRSNLWLSNATIPDFQALQSAGITLGLGTDSRLSSPSLDLREEARSAQILHGLSSKAIFELITAGAASAIKLADTIGHLKPGYAADMVLWHHPADTIENPYDAWLSPETTVSCVWINGRVVLERGLVDQPG